MFERSETSHHAFGGRGSHPSLSYVATSWLCITPKVWNILAIGVNLWLIWDLYFAGWACRSLRFFRLWRQGFTPQPKMCRHFVAMHNAEGVKYLILMEGIWNPRLTRCGFQIRIILLRVFSRTHAVRPYMWLMGFVRLWCRAAIIWQPYIENSLRSYSQAQRPAYL